MFQGTANKGKEILFVCRLTNLYSEQNLKEVILQTNCLYYW